MSELLNQIEKNRAKANTMIHESEAAHFLNLNANLLEELSTVVESAKNLRDYCLKHSGTPPMVLVCELDADLLELEPAEPISAKGPCEHNDWYEVKGWRYCRQCIRHWDAEFMVKHMDDNPAEADDLYGDAIEEGLKDARIQQLEDVCDAARYFIDQYTHVIASEAYKGVWATLDDFGIGYTGPLFRDPSTLKGLLEKVELPPEKCPECGEPIEE